MREIPITMTTTWWEGQRKFTFKGVGAFSVPDDYSEQNIAEAVFNLEMRMNEVGLVRVWLELPEVEGGQ